MFTCVRNYIFDFVRNKSVQFYVLIVVALVVQTYIFLDLVNMPYTYGIHTILLILFSDVFVITLPYWLFPSRYRWAIWFVLLFLILWQLSNIWYARTYLNLMPFSSYFLFENVNSLLVSSIIDSVNRLDLLLFCPGILLAILYNCFYKSVVLKNEPKKGFVWIVLVGTLITVATSQSFFLFQQYANRYDYRYEKQFKDCYIETTLERLKERGYHRMDYYMMNGFVAYIIHYMSDFAPKRKLTNQENDKINNFFNRKPQYDDNNYAIQNKNLILIVVESLNSWVVDYEIDGKKVAPTLSQLFGDSSNYVVRNVVPQVCNGRSCDAHFMYNTGLLPSRDVVTAVTFGDVAYPSLAKALKKKNYNCVEIIGDEATFANQGITRISYGFDALYDVTNKKQYNDLEKYEVDSIVFENAINLLDELPQPFYSMIVSLSMHFPFDLAPCPVWIAENTTLKDDAKGYLSLVYTFDRQLLRFITHLKERGLYENSLIVIVGDHNGYDKNKLENRENVFIEDLITPMVIINPLYGGIRHSELGQIDVYPTILDAIGANEYSWKGVGMSALRFPKIGSVIDRYGVLIGYSDENVIQMQREAWDISELIIHSRYFDDFTID